jgi:hypothetical protein
MNPQQACGTQPLDHHLPCLVTLGWLEKVGTPSSSDDLAVWNLKPGSGLADTVIIEV